MSADKTKYPKPVFHCFDALPQPKDMNIHDRWKVPDDEECFRLWDKYDMLDNIRAHSLMVAQVATAVAKYGVARGIDVDVATVRASALLHDIAKTYTIKHGGNHSQLGASWVLEETGNPVIASGVAYHVFWPFELDMTKYFTPLAVLYADKRVRHDSMVSIEDRFADLLERYGAPYGIEDRIINTRDQAVEVEQRFSELLKVNLNENSFDSGRLV